MGDEPWSLSRVRERTPTAGSFREAASTFGQEGTHLSLRYLRTEILVLLEFPWFTNLEEVHSR